MPHRSANRSCNRSTRASNTNHARGIFTGILCAAVFTGLVALMAGCSESATRPAETAGAFYGPSMRIVTSGEEHVIVMTSPSPGWVPEVTRTLDGYHHRRVYVTVRSPNPAISYAARMVDQEISTGVPADRAIRVYARVIPFDADILSEAPYSLAAEAAPDSGDPAQPQTLPQTPPQTQTPATSTANP